MLRKLFHYYVNKIPRKYLYLSGAIVALFILYAGFNLIYHYFSRPPEAFPTMVEAEKIKMEKWHTEINTTGSLHAKPGILLKAETNGRITKLFFESGQYVQQDAPLVQLNPDILNAELAANQAKLVLSKVQYSREQELFKKHVNTQSALDIALAQMNADQANVDRSKAQLNQLLIRAPFNGKIGLRLIELGDFVSAGDPIANLQSLDPMRVDFSIPEIYLTQLAVGQTVIVQSRSYPGEKFIGKVYAYDSLINPDNRSLAVRAKIPNASNKLVSGTFVEIILRTGTEQTVMAVPETAIVYDEDGNFIYRIIKGHAIKTLVSIGPQQGNRVAILEGLSPNDIVITAGQLKIGDGAPVVDRATLAKSK